MKTHLVRLSSLAAVAAQSAHAHALNPQGSSPITQALDRILGTLMGKVATTCAVIAVVGGIEAVAN